jgi:hypothetical protein
VSQSRAVKARIDTPRVPDHRAPPRCAGAFGELDNILQELLRRGLVRDPDFGWRRSREASSELAALAREFRDNPDYESFSDLLADITDDIAKGKAELANADAPLEEMRAGVWAAVRAGLAVADRKAAKTALIPDLRAADRKIQKIRRALEQIGDLHPAELTSPWRMASRIGGTWSPDDEIYVEELARRLWWAWGTLQGDIGALRMRYAPLLRIGAGAPSPHRVSVCIVQKLLELWRSWVPDGRKMRGFPRERFIAAVFKAAALPTPVAPEDFEGWIVNRLARGNSAKKKT